MVVINPATHTVCVVAGEPSSAEAEEAEAVEGEEEGAVGAEAEAAPARVEAGHTHIQTNPQTHR